MDLNFKKNGKSAHHVLARGDTPDGLMVVSLRIWGTWFLKESNLTEDIRRSRVTGLTLDGRKVPKGPRWDALETLLLENMEISDDDPGRITPISNAQFKYAGEEVTLTCTRKGAVPTS